MPDHFDTQSMQRVMSRLGFTHGRIARDVSAYHAQTSLHGQPVTAFVLNQDRCNPPDSLTDQVWVGYYETANGLELLDEAEYPTLAEYLFEQIAPL